MTPLERDLRSLGTLPVTGKERTWSTLKASLLAPAGPPLPAGAPITFPCLAERDGVTVYLASDDSEHEFATSAILHDLEEVPQP